MTTATGIELDLRTRSGDRFAGGRFDRLIREHVSARHSEESR